MAKAVLVGGNRPEVQLSSATLFALSSGRGAAGVAVIRLAGPQAFAAARTLAGKLPPPRQVGLRSLRDPESGALLDQALVLCFAGPASFTGEDVVEIHAHGGPAVVAGLLDALGRLPGLAPAGPGDFTRRAFQAGKLDLAQVEGLADLIAAETEAQRAQALAQMGGALSSVIEGWRNRLIKALAWTEAEIDFGEEEADVGTGVAAAVRPQVEGLVRDIAAALADGGRGERLRDGLSIAIIGAPNAGKSSLINALAKRDAAIVSPIAGTTRDSIEVHLNLGGVPVTLIDTAGLRDTNDPIEAEGVRRARVRAASADLVLHLIAAPEWPAQVEPGAWGVVNKIDLDATLWPGTRNGVQFVSVATGAGLDALIAALAEWARAAVPSGDAALITRARHRAALAQCQDSLTAALAERDMVLAAEQLRCATSALGRITGRVDVEDLLDVIFSDFCIGK